MQVISTLADIYPAFPLLQSNYSGTGSICGHMLLKNTNLWFFSSLDGLPILTRVSKGCLCGSRIFDFPGIGNQARRRKKIKTECECGEGLNKRPFGTNL